MQDQPEVPAEDGYYDTAAAAADEYAEEVEPDQPLYDDVQEVPAEPEQDMYDDVQGVLDQEEPDQPLYDDATAGEGGEVRKRH